MYYNLIIGISSLSELYEILFLINYVIYVVFYDMLGVILEHYYLKYFNFKT